ncbi:hypothetical protein ACGFNU_26055 [Spirillospora sp. NPDC048911]|uniref:class I SAM-dependent methyltransferase n=1 Tax=Spirillospora sp. NPDC048911 TaxID=3364527 RepID=UPI00371208BF
MTPIPGVQSHGVQLVGGEMTGWSDDGGRLPGGAALEDLVLRAVPAGGSALIAGPHRAELVDRLIEHCGRVTCLLRSLPDAQDLGRRHADSARLTVLCGGLDKLGDIGPFDAVVAAGGLGRLHTPDSAVPAWSDGVERLTRALAPGGVLVIGAENELGVHRLVDPAPADVPGTDEQWHPPHGVDTTVPGDPAELAARVSGDGAAAVRCFAAYPDLAGPGLLVDVDELDRGRAADGVVAVLVAAALTGEVAGGQVLADPRRLARRSLAQGLGARLAPAWIVVVRPGGALPAAVVGDDAPGHWAVSYALTGREDGWERAAVRDPGLRTTGRVQREAARLAGPVPGGRLLDELLHRLCAMSDVPGLRRLLQAYAGWLAGQPATARVFATPDNVIVDGDRFAVLDPSWELADDEPFDVALALALRRFAARLLGGGHRHPWPTTLDLDGIASTLLAMAGHPGDRVLLGTAVRLEAEIGAARRGLPAAEHARLLAELEAGETGEPLGHREALLARRRLGEELAEARARAEWLDAKLRAKEDELARTKETAEHRRAQVKELKTQLRGIRASKAFKFGRMVTAPPRVARRNLRRL